MLGFIEPSLKGCPTCAVGAGAAAVPSTRRRRRAGNLVTDEQIAAHAIEHNGEVSNGADFARCEGLRWIDPLDG